MTASQPTDPSDPPALPAATVPATSGRSVLTAVRRRWKLLAGCILASMALTTVLTQAATPTYRATVDVMVVPSKAAKDVGDEYQASLLGISLATGYARIIDTEGVAKGVIDTLRLEETAPSLQSRTSATPVQGTSLITVEVTDTDPVIAARIANTLPLQLNAALAELVPGRTPDATVRIVERARPPTVAADPRPATNYAIGLILAVLVGVALAVGADRRANARGPRTSPRRRLRRTRQAPAAVGDPGAAAGERPRRTGGEAFAAGGLLRGTLVYFVVKAVPSAAALAGIVVFIHLGGSATYGAYSVAYAAAAFTTSLGVGWLIQAALRFAGDATASWSMIARWSVWASTATVGVTTFAICSVTLPDSSPIISVGAGLLAAAIATQAVVVTIMQSELATLSVLRAELFRAVAQFGVPTCALLLVARSSTVLLLAMAAATVAAVAPFYRRLLTNRAAVRGSAIRAWWSYGWPVSLWLSLASVFQYADRILLAHWHGTSAAGSYAAVYDVVNGGLAVCLFPITMAAFPRISTRWNGGDLAGALQENRIAIRAQILLFLPVLVVAALTRSTLTRILLGTTAPEVVDTVIPILLGAFCWQLALSVHKRLQLERRTRLMLLFAALAAGANVVANIVTIPKYGGVAAAWTTFGSAALYLSLCWCWQAVRGRSPTFASPSSVADNSRAQVDDVRGELQQEARR